MKAVVYRHYGGQAFAHMAEQRHFGKLVINIAGG
jgi:hypothetical protein